MFDLSQQVTIDEAHICLMKVVAVVPQNEFQFVAFVLL